MRDHHPTSHKHDIEYIPNEDVSIIEDESVFLNES